MILNTGEKDNPITFSSHTGVSPSALIVQDMLDRVRREFISSNISFGDHLAVILEELLKLKDETSVINWDGYGAVALNNESFQVSEKFALSLPFDTPIPNVYAMATGEVVFEWYRGKRQLFSVMVGGDSTLSYAGLFGTDTDFGTVHFDEKIPLILISNIQRVYS